MAAAVLTGLLPVSAAFAVSGVGVGADEVDDEAVAVLGGGAAGGGVDEFESVIGTIFRELLYYSRVHISSDTTFLKILKKPSIVQDKCYLI